jgi:hypothetical protein
VIKLLPRGALYLMLCDPVADRGIESAYLCRVRRIIGGMRADIEVYASGLDAALLVGELKARGNGNGGLRSSNVGWATVTSCFRGGTAPSR